jgi:alkaline phosphatase
MKKINRRDLLKTGALAGMVSLGGVTTSTAKAQSNQPAIMTRARNVILFAYDGLSWEDYAIAQYYARRKMGKRLALERLMMTGIVGQQNTNSLTSFVTESSAAGNAWSTGVKTVNGGLAIHIDGRKLEPMFKLAKEAGKAVGLVSTATITHATPASFIVSNPDRNAEEQIAEQYLDFGADVYLGGGQRFFDAAVRRDKKDLYAAFAAKGYGVVKTTAELRASNASKLLGVFSSSHVPYEVDRRFQNVDVPSLLEMTKKALPILSGAKNGFVLQVEAARIDHAAHLNDPAGVMWDIIAADETLEYLLSYVDSNPDTMLIIGSDHACGTGALYGTGAVYRASSAGIELLENHKASIEFMLGKLGSTPAADQVAELVRNVRGTQLTPEQAQSVVDAITKKVYLPDGVVHGVQPANTFAWAMRQTNAAQVDRPNIGFASGQHNASPTLFAVYGRGVAAGRVGLVDNTYTFELMARALNIRFKNPAMTEEEALRVLSEQAPKAAIGHPQDVVAD